jgi:hypothetical protein
MTSSRGCTSPCWTLRMDSKEVGEIVQIETSSIGKVEESTEEIAVLARQSCPGTAVPGWRRSMWSGCDSLMYSEHPLPVWVVSVSGVYTPCGWSMTSLIPSALGWACAIGAWRTSIISAEEVCGSEGVGSAGYMSIALLPVVSFRGGILDYTDLLTLPPTLRFLRLPPSPLCRLSSAFRHSRQFKAIIGRIPDHWPTPARCRGRSSCTISQTG